MARHSEPTATDFFQSIHAKLHETAFQQSLVYDYNFEEDHPQTYKGHYQWEKDPDRPSLLSFPRSSVSTMVTLTQEPLEPLDPALPELALPADFSLADMEVAGEGQTQPPQSLSDGLRTRRRALTDPE